MEVKRRGEEEKCEGEETEKKGGRNTRRRKQGGRVEGEERP